MVIIIFVAACSRYIEPNTRLIVKLSNVDAIDYDPVKNVIYYIDSDDRLNFEDNSQFIKSYNLVTNQHEIVAENFPYLTEPWIGIGKSGQIYVLDNGRNPFYHSWEEPNKRYILVYKDKAIIDSYELELTDGNNCKDFLSPENPNSYLGLERDLNGNIYPKFIIPENIEDNKIAYEINDCDKSHYDKNLKYHIGRNLQIINEDTFINTQGQKNHAWVNLANDFNFSIKHKRLAIFAKMQCEREFDEINFKGKKYNMGSCIWGIHAFPSSGNFFDIDGNLIYVSISGINILEK